MTEAITIQESKRLIELESVINSSRETFQKVARALCEIRDRKLYRGECKTFAEYCSKRYGWAKSYGYNMAKAGEALNELPDSTIVENPSQARELSKVEPEKRVEVLEKAAESAKAEGKPLTARHIEAAAEPGPEAQPDFSEFSRPSAESDTSMPKYYGTLLEETFESWEHIGLTSQQISVVLGVIQVWQRKWKDIQSRDALNTK